MKKSDNHKFINKRGLKGILKEKEIRTSADAIQIIEEEIKSFTLKLLDSSREEMKIFGKRTLGKEQVKIAIKKIFEKN